jgi:hypothetical protein
MLYEEMESLLLVIVFDLIFPNVLIIGKHKGIQEEELVFGFSPMANTPILLHDHNEVG